MVVTLRTAKRRTQPHAGDVSHAVGRVDCAVLFRLCTALLGGLQQSIVPGGDPLRDARLRQQVTRQLLNGEFVVRFVVVERIDHIIPIRRDFANRITVIPDCVRVPHEIEPVRRHPLTVTRVIEQLLHEFLVCTGRPVVDERLDLPRQRRHAQQVVVQPTSQRHAVRLLRGLQPRRLDPAQHEPVDVIDHERLIFRFGRGHPIHRFVGPVQIVLRPLSDPLLQQRLLPIVQLLAGVRRRHQVVLVFGENAGHEFALRRLARHHGGIIAKVSQCPLTSVEAQIGLSMLSVRPVAGETIITQQGPNIPSEIDPSRFFF